jgi:beta-galactosidase
MPDGQAEPLVREVKELIRSLDSRPIVAASNNPKKKELNSIPDALGFNMYPGWYGGESSDLGRQIEEWRIANGRNCVAISEYGAGGSLGQDTADEGIRPNPDGKFHPFSYQLRHHKASWAAIKGNPNVWGAFVWVMFDCGSDSRREGARDGINDKGLVGFDHTTMKPVYDFYRAEWN